MIDISGNYYKSLSDPLADRFGVQALTLSHLLHFPGYLA
jgi:hypothetical protein